VPVQGLVDPGYLAARAQLIRPEKSMGKAAAGAPQGIKIAYADDASNDVPGTSHIAIVDRDGNAVSLTTTIEAYFGSRVMVRGFLLNNELTDFSFLPTDDSMPVANSVAPGKRPRSSMAPTLVFDHAGELYLVLGSPGASLIIGYVTKVLVAMLDWKMDIQSAIDLPNFDSRNGATEIEKDTAMEKLVGPLKSLGHEVTAMEMNSGIHGIARVGNGWQGGADPRREGIAKGH
jgi:gamma-glutamyltranspeptidase / glutathione hydrolase